MQFVGSQIMFSAQHNKCGYENLVVQSLLLLRMRVKSSLQDVQSGQSLSHPGLVIGQFSDSRHLYFFQLLQQCPADKNGNQQI